MRQRRLARSLAAAVAGLALVAGASGAGRSLAVVATASAAEAPSSAAQLEPAPARTPGVAPPLEQRFLVADGVVRRTLAFGTGGLPQTLDVYGPVESAGPRPTVLLVHGGSWQLGDSTEWVDEAVELVRSRGWTAVSLNYRLAPEHPWPAAYDDAVAALRLLHARADDLGVDPDRIGAVGDSAGAHLAALLAEPASDRPALRAVVTWSGLNDLTGVTRQPSSGGCQDAAERPCDYGGLAVKLVRDLMGCEPIACETAYRQASPAAIVTPGHAPTLSISSEGEQVDPRQAWVLDAALSRNGVASRVEVLAGSLHARGYQQQVWARTLRFLAAMLTPTEAAPYPRPAVVTTLDLPARSEAPVGRAVVLSGVVRPRQLGSSVTLEVRQGDGSWRAARHAPLQRGDTDTHYTTTWTPLGPGTVVWRATWRGGGGVHSTTPRAVVVR